VAGVDDRIAEAEAALVTLDEAIGKSTSSLLERDGAILSLIYTFEAVWKASQQLLAEHEGITVASPNATIRAARRVGWLSDEDARAAFDIANDRNAAVHMYRGEIGAEIERHLAGHAALLRRWLVPLQQRKEPEQLP
jgi:Nucleotidyltransferase substrate binding protein like